MIKLGLDNDWRERDWIFLDKVEEKISEFFGRLQALGWMCFVKEPFIANHTIVDEFYAIDSETNFGGEVATMIRRVRIDFISSTINVIYGLLNADNRVYRERL